MSQTPQAPQHPTQATQHPSQAMHTPQATHATHSNVGASVVSGARQRVSTETKSALKTTELIAYVATVIGVLVASAMADGETDFGPRQAWFLVTLLTIGYLVSRGLAKSGCRDFYDRDEAGSR